jgi:hypothetical protein
MIHIITVITVICLQHQLGEPSAAANDPTYILQLDWSVTIIRLAPSKVPPGDIRVLLLHQLCHTQAAQAGQGGGQHRGSGCPGGTSQQRLRLALADVQGL